jgi:hypothetical protein
MRNATVLSPVHGPRQVAGYGMPVRTTGLKRQFPAGTPQLTRPQASRFWQTILANSGRPFIWLPYKAHDGAVIPQSVSGLILRSSKYRRNRAGSACEAASPT